MATTLYLMRHNHAEAGVGKADSERDLSPAGVDSVRKQGAALVRAGVRLRCVATSPFKRAHQTAQLLHEMAGEKEAPLIALPELASQGGTCEDTIGALARSHRSGTILVVGHLPEVALILGSLLVAQPLGPFSFEPGTMACVEFEGSIRIGSGVLRWLMLPSQLAGWGVS